MGQNQKKFVARGTKRPSGSLAAIVEFPPDMFHEVRTMAIEEGNSFSEQARLLVEWGLGSLETESDNLL